MKCLKIANRKEIYDGELSLNLLPHFLLLWFFLLPLFLYSQDNVKLENIKKISLTINKDNTLTFAFAEAPPEVIPLRTYKKTIETKEERFLISYGLNIKEQETLFIQLKESKSPSTQLELSKQLISMTPGSSLTILIGDSAKESVITPSLTGSVTLNGDPLPSGLPSSLIIKKTKETPDPQKTPPPVKPPRKIESPTKVANQETAPQRPPPTIKSIERRQIQIKTLRETTQSLTPAPPVKAPVNPTPDEVVIHEIKIQQDPEEEKPLIRENQVLLQISVGLQNILDQITNDPLSADTTFKGALPPLPPPPVKPIQSSTNEWIAKLQTENIDYRKKAIQTRTQLIKFLETLAKPSFRLTPLIPETIQEEARLASKAYKQQNWMDAILHYQNALKIEPNSLHLLSNLGVVYFSQGNYDEAEKILLQTVEQAPHDSFSYSILGICYLQKEELEKAINALFISVNMNPKDAQSQNYLAMTLTKKGWLKTAEEHARESIQLNPNYSEAHYNLAQIYANQKPIARELAKKHYNLSVNLGGSRDESLEKLLQILPQTTAPSEPQIQVNP